MSGNIINNYLCIITIKEDAYGNIKECNKVANSEKKTTATINNIVDNYDNASDASSDNPLMDVAFCRKNAIPMQQGSRPINLSHNRQSAVPSAGQTHGRISNEPC